MKNTARMSKSKVYQAVKRAVHDWFHGYANNWCDTDEEEELIAAITQSLIAAITEDLIAAITRKALVTGLLAEINNAGSSPLDEGANIP